MKKKQGPGALRRWAAGQPDHAPEGDLLSRASGALTGLLARGGKRCRLERLLGGSVFLHPAFFLILTAALLPFLPTMALLALAAASGLSLILTCAVGQGRPRLYTPALRWVGLLAVVYLLSIAVSVTPRTSLLPGLLMTAFVLYTFAAYLSPRNYGTLRTVFSAIVLGGVLVSLYGFWQKLHPAAYQTGWLDEDMFSSITFRVYATFANPNVLGEYFLLVIPFAFALAFTAPNRRKKLLWAAAAAAMCVCMLLTYSRGCYLGLLLSVLVFLVLLDWRFLIPAAVLLALSPLYVPDSIWQRLLSIGNMGDTSTSYRASIWIGTLRMLKDFWLCGVGPGENPFNSVYPVYALSAVDAPHSHNLYLQLICDTGITGLIVFLGFLGSLLRSLITTMRHCRRRETKIFAIAGISAFAGVLLQGMTDYTFYNYRVMLLFFLMAGLCLLLRQEEALITAHGTVGELMLRERGKPLVLHILSDTNMGGAGQYLLNLFSAYDREQYAMALVVPRGAVMKERAKLLGIPVVEAEIPGERSMDLRSIFALRRICILLQPELVQSHGSLSGRIAARACGAKIIYTRHSVFPVSPRLKAGPGHWASRWLNRHYADLCLAVSPAAEENLLELGARKDRIVTMMNGAPALTPASAEEKQALRQKYGLAEGEFTAGILARMEEYKGQTTVVDAAKILEEQGRHLKVLICGAGSMEAPLRQKIRELGLENTVILCGFVENVAGVLSILDVQLNASTGTETSSLALIEGMSLGLPTIASAYGGNPYLIRDGQEGLLFRPGDARQLAACIARLMDDPALGQTLGRNGNAAYMEKYTARAFAANVEAAYERALGKGAAR